MSIVSSLCRVTVVDDVRQVPVGYYKDGNRPVW